MKKLTALVFSLPIAVVLLLVSSNNALASTSGPAGVNGLRAYSGADKGQVVLEWSRVTLTGENYTIKYGTTPGFYPFVASHVGYVATYTVSNLIPGQRYYFVLERIQIGDVSLGYNGEVSAVAASGPQSVVIPSGPIGRNHLTATTGTKSGQVVLKWLQFFPDTTSWHLVFGNKPGQYAYGALNIVKTTSGITEYSYTVDLLKPGTRYYFALVPVRGGQAQYFSTEVSAVAR